MQKEIIKFIEDKQLSPFSNKKTILKTQKTIFKTSDARTVANKLLQHFSSSFFFTETSNLFSFFEFSELSEIIKNRQDFWAGQKLTNDCLRNVEKSKMLWKIPYTLIAVTEKESTFMELKSRGVPTRLILSDNDVLSLEQYDLVYVIDCEEYTRALEQVSGTFFTRNIEDIHLEKNLVELSGWKDIVQHLKKEENLPLKMAELRDRVSSLFSIFEATQIEKIDLIKIEKVLENMNRNIESQLQSLTISGAQIVSMMQKGSLPQQINSIIQEEINKSNLPTQFFTKSLPIAMDEEEIDKALRIQSSNSSTKFAKKILSEKEIIKLVPELLKQLSSYLIYLDFVGGIQKKLTGFIFPEISEDLLIENSINKLLTNPQKISFNLSQRQKCSILTGANSGGKTTLLEHIIHIILETQIGLPTENNLKIPLFSEVYYFAKNKGSTSKGAFETLLTEISTIKLGKQTLILADEVEAVTEPGVAGQIMKSTIEYFVPKGCFMILATHLGKELQQDLPLGARIDGIEATGLDSEFNLIVNHNPVLGRLARSTPELIVEKMAKSNGNEYLLHLYSSLKNKTA